MAKILLIDDDVDLVEMNSIVLQSRGHEVVTALSAAEARRLLDSGLVPDAAVLDVMMEDQTAGFVLARELQERLPDMPKIMLSGIHEATGVPFRFTPDETWLPVMKFLDKPVPPALLADEIELVLRKS